MQSIDTLEDLFVHELRTMYYVETELIDVLDEIALETRDDDVSETFADHRDQTREHVARLEDVFDALGEPHEAERSAALDGLVEDRQSVASAADDQELIDTHTLGAGVKTERLEISGYESLLQLADELDYGEEVTDPLDQTLDEEIAARRELAGHVEGSTLKQLLGKFT